MFFRRASFIKRGSSFYPFLFIGGSGKNEVIVGGGLFLRVALAVLNVAKYLQYAAH